MTIIRGICRMHARHRSAAALAFALCVSAARVEGQIAVSSEIQGALYPREAAGRQARNSDARGWGQIEYKRSLSSGLEFRGDLIVYGPHRQRAFAERNAALVWAGLVILRSPAGFCASAGERLQFPPGTPWGPQKQIFRLSNPKLPSNHAGHFGKKFFLGGLAGGTFHVPPPRARLSHSFGNPKGCL